MILINGQKLEFTKFPNGEVCMRDFDDAINSNFSNEEEITLSYESDQDIMNLIFVKKHIDEEYNTKVNLNLVYMPYSRMDRTEGMNVFTLKYVAEIINSLKFDLVTVLEPHSDVTPALLNNCDIIEKTKEILEKLLERLVEDGYEKPEDIYLVFPDASADKRYNKGIWDNTLTCVKHRDFETGRIKSLDIVGEKPSRPFRAIIVDDLCSKGGTFMLTAEKLKEMGAKSIALVVTHCEDTIFEGDILKTDLINKVYTTNSILRGESIRINCEDVL